MMTDVSQRLPITVRLESFEGPLDLLLYLIQSHELDISRISITQITDQYLAYVQLLQELNFDTASEFLVMAATLLHWKSKAVLPQEKFRIRPPMAMKPECRKKISFASSLNISAFWLQEKTSPSCRYWEKTFFLVPIASPPPSKSPSQWI